jgi:hypothetical protein
MFSTAPSIKEQYAAQRRALEAEAARLEEDIAQLTATLHNRGWRTDGVRKTVPATPPLSPQRPEPGLRDTINPAVNPAAAAAAASAAAAAVAPPPLQKRYSVKSQAAMDDLELIEARLLSLEKGSAEAERELRAAYFQPEQLDPALRDQLAQLYGDVTALVSSGSAGTKENPVGTVPLDGFVTGELNSAQGDAKAKRKALVGRAEALAARIKTQVARCDKLRSGSPAE